MYETFEKLLEKNKVTAYQVCPEPGIKQSTISDWKAGRYTPKVDKMQKLADYFNVPLEMLLK